MKQLFKLQKVKAGTYLVVLLNRNTFIGKELILVAMLCSLMWKYRKCQAITVYNHRISTVDRVPEVTITPN